MQYIKPPSNIDEQIDLLICRGLVINDRDRARKYLANIGYYRLTGYMYHLQSDDGTHTFTEGTTFDQIISHYQFDKKLRMLFLEYLERIEVALRAKLTYVYSLSYGFGWYTDKTLYDDVSVFTTINGEILDKFEQAQV